MAAIDDVLNRARTMLTTDCEVFRVHRDSLQIMLDEYDRLRTALRLPDDNRVGLHRRNGEATSHDAAVDVFPRSGIQRHRCLLAVAESRDGCTDADIADATGIYIFSVVPRRNELMRGGWVADSGRTRATGNGGEGIVWVLTDKARLALESRAS